MRLLQAHTQRSYSSLTHHGADPYGGRCADAGYGFSRRLFILF